MQTLAHIHNVDGFFEVVLVEFHHRQGNILGGVERGPVRTQDDHHAVFLIGAQYLVQVDHDRQVRAAVLCQTGLNQLVNGCLSRFFHLTFKVNAVEVFTQQVINLTETFQRPIARFLPESQDMRVPCVPAGKISANFRLEALFIGKAPVSLGKEVAHPARLICPGSFSRVVLLVIA